MRRKLLADGEGHVGQLAQRLIGFRRLVADRLLEEIERARRHLLAEARGLRDRQAVVVVDAEHDGLAELLARLDAPLRRLGDALARLVDAAAVVAGREEADGAPAHRHQFLRLLDHLGAARALGRREGRDVVALLAAEQLIDRHAERLALDVVQRDVDRRDRGRAARGRPRNTGCGTSPARARRWRTGRGRSGTRDSARSPRRPPSRGRKGRSRPSRRCPRRSRP